MRRNTSVPEEAPAVRVDGEAGAGEVAMGAMLEVEVSLRPHDSAARMEAERGLGAQLKVLVLGAQNEIGERALVNHVFEAGARVPAIVPGVTGGIEVG